MFSCCETIFLKVACMPRINGRDSKRGNERGKKEDQKQKERGVGELQGENCRSGIMKDYCAGAGGGCGGASESWLSSGHTRQRSCQ